jgi:hypothetical protein
MKYIEELNNGDAFVVDQQIFLLTSDFKKNGSKLAYSLKNGNPKWFEASHIVDAIQIYTMDETNTIIPIKETPKDDYSSQNITIS